MGTPPEVADSSAGTSKGEAAAPETEQRHLVHLDIVGGIATLTLDSPHNRNALSVTLVAQLGDGLARCSADDTVRAVILTHTGSTFCAGADLGEALARGASPAEASAAGTEAMLTLISSILRMPKPVIARIDGHVRAGGLGLLGACDMVFSGPASSFALTEARLGLAPAVISVVLLPKMTARASGRYYLSGERFDALAAQECGLITQSCASSEELDQVVAEVMAGIGKGSPQGLAAAKALTTAPILAAFERDAHQRAAESAALFDSDDAREGMMAFLGKRAPRWDLTAATATIGGE